MIQATVYHQGNVVFQGFVDLADDPENITIFGAMDEMALQMKERGQEYDDIECRFVGIGAMLFDLERAFTNPTPYDVREMERQHEAIAATVR